MAQKQYEGRGTVHMNPLGPHFYVKTEEGEKPSHAVDVVTDMMNLQLAGMDERHGWPIIHEHIRADVPITEVTWESVDGAVSFELGDFDVSLDWYSRKALRDYDEVHY